MPDDLSLVPLEELVAEIAGRSDAMALALYKDVTNQSFNERIFKKGHPRLIQGLALGIIAEAQTAIKATERDDPS